MPGTMGLCAGRHRAVENTAWGSYRSEFYPTYDDKAIAAGHRGGAQ